METVASILDPALIAEVRRIELRTRRKVNADLSGSYRSAFRGSGLVFSDVRDYQPGDDVRRIHWKLSARTNKVYVKSFEEDRLLRIQLMLDLSRSTKFGSPKNKHRLTLEFAALISLLAQKNGDALGLALFSDRIEEYLPPKRSRKQALKVILSLLQQRDLPPRTDLASSLRELRKNSRRRSLLFIVSDFLSPKFDEELRAASRNNDVICVFLEDPSELEAPDAGIVDFEDSESGETFTLDLGSEEGRRLFVEEHLKRKDRIRRICSGAGADFVVLRDSPLEPLRELMRRRINKHR